jgi:hypothetical protein
MAGILCAGRGGGQVEEEGHKARVRRNMALHAADRREIDERHQAKLPALRRQAARLWPASTL